MLVELTIRNFAIIEDLTVSFDKGLTVLTGETGAGKSIIIDAIGLLAGGRGSFEFIRYGTNRAELEGLFSVEPGHRVVEKARSLGIETEDGTIILRRDMTIQGKSICRINGKLVTLSVLREIGQLLVDIHGQHEHQTLMQAEQHLFLLDSFAKEKLAPALQEYKQLFKAYKQLHDQLRQMTENEQALAQRVDLIQYQLEEIRKADLHPHEDQDLFSEKYKLANSEKLFKAMHDGYSSLYGDEKGLDWVSVAVGHLEEASAIDKDLLPLYESVSNCFYLLEEASHQLREKTDQIEFDPNRLNYIESRLNEINGLKRKYGETVEDILEYAAKIEDELDDLIHKDDRIHQLKEQLDATKLDMLVEAKELSSIRQEAAKELKAAIERELAALYMEKTNFFIEFKQSSQHNNEVSFHGLGIDSVEFLMSTNPGEPVKPLAKIASGGEISRIMLALKTIFSNHQGVTSIIFDEVDTGVSGRVAQAIAEKIHQVSHHSQVLCITHLPQVASMADTHLYIAKEEIHGRVITSVTPMERNDKIQEIARMISGVEITDVTKQHAQELIQLAEKMKTNS